MQSVRFRLAEPSDAVQVADLHADSWRRNYRGAYADCILDGDVAADRRSAWSARLSAWSETLTLLAEGPHGVVGFVHVVFDQDEVWGSRIDNLHVTHDHQGEGIGGGLLSRAAEGAAARGRDNPLYLWVLEQNVRAQKFYLAFGAQVADRTLV